MLAVSARSPEQDAGPSCTGHDLRVSPIPAFHRRASPQEGILKGSHLDRPPALCSTRTTAVSFRRRRVRTDVGCWQLVRERLQHRCRNSRFTGSTAFRSRASLPRSRSEGPNTVRRGHFSRPRDSNGAQEKAFHPTADWGWGFVPRPSAAIRTPRHVRSTIQQRGAQRP